MNDKLKTPLLDGMSKEKEAENGLSTIARKSHNNNFLTWQYPFLHLTPENENTYELGFMAGVMYATGEMDKIRAKQEAPTINRYENLSQLGEQC